MMPRHIRQKQLEYRLNDWGFRKKLSPDIWRSVRSIIQARAAELKESVVILSGRRLPVEKVDGVTERHQVLSLLRG